MFETQNRVLFGFEELDKLLGHTYNVSGISQGSLNFIVCDKPEQEKFFFNYMKNALTESNIRLSNEPYVNRTAGRIFDESVLDADISLAFELNIYHTTRINTNPNIYLLRMDPDNAPLDATTNQLMLMERSLAALRNKLFLLNVTLLVLLKKKDYDISNSYKTQADNVLHVSYSKIDNMFNISKSIRFMVDKARQGKTRIAIEYLVK